MWLLTTKPAPPLRADRFLFAGLILTACSGEASGPSFDPEFHSRQYLAAEDAAAPGDVANPYLQAGFRAPVDRYVVPEFLCVRRGGADWLDMPGKAKYPGEPTFFDVVYPASGQSDPAKPLLLHLHGSGLEFMESVAIIALKKFPSVAEAFGIKQGAATIDVEQTTQEWSKQTLESSEKQPFLAVAVERGYTVVFPAN
ncbi:MAG: hypothetical protein HYT87_05060 [Nitrospirae bacterium]|nr:hypothetical protein [Nitrospirota bacterium]